MKNVPMKRCNLPPRFLYTVEAGRFLGLSGRTLEKHRTFGTGPAYIKLGGRVIYKIRDLLEWAEQGRQWSTLEPGADLYPRPKENRAEG